MTFFPPPPEDLDREELLSEVLAEPFAFLSRDEGLTESPLIHQWYGYLAGTFRLWSWQSWRFAVLQDTELPSTHPLGILIDSLRSDDVGDRRELSPLESNLNARRLDIADEHYSGLSPCLVWDGEWPGGAAGFLAFENLYDFTDYEYATGDLASPYEDIGRELMRLVEARDTARRNENDEALHEAEERLEDFERSLGARLGRGRPREGPSELLLQTLFEEGCELLGLLWHIFPFEVSDRTHDLLSRFEPSEDERVLWAARLALPQLSRPELRALRDPEERGWTALRGIDPSPQRLCVWILSRRLSLEPVYVARRTVGARASETFEDASNPVDRFTE